MKNFTQEQIKRFNEESREIMNAVSQGESTRDIMARIYVERLEEKTLEQGLAMADAIIESVHQFDKDYMEAREDLDKYLEKFVKKAEKGKSVRERCDYWLRLAASVNAAGIVLNDETADKAKLMDELKDLSIPEEEATEEKAEELRNEALEAIRNSGILILGLQQSTDALREIESADETAALLVDIGGRETETRAIMSMIAYTEVKSGEYENIPVDMTPEQITTEVCVTMEEIRIAEGVENGSIHIEVAEILLTVLGIMSIVAAALVICNFGFAFVMSLLIPMWIKKTLLFGMVYGLVCLGIKVGSGWTEITPNAARFVVKAAKAIGRGFKTIFSFLYEKVVLGAVNLAKKMWNALKTKFGKKNKDNAETENDEDIIEIIDEEIPEDDGGMIVTATV